MNYKGSVGEQVVVSRLGLREVKELQPDGSVVIEDDGSKLCLPPEQAARRIRPPVSPKEAEEVQQIFIASSSKALHGQDEYERNRFYQSAIQGNDLKQMAIALRALYGIAEAGYPEEYNATDLENALFSELNYVLNKRPGILKRQFRKAAGVFSLPNRSKKLAEYRDYPGRNGYESVGPFAVEGTLIVGEGGTGVELPTLPGVWLAYFAESAPGSEVPELFAVHADYVDKIVNTLLPRGNFAINGASMAIVEALAMKDRGFRQELDLGTEGVINGFGVQRNTGSDGAGSIAVAEYDGQIVAVCLSMC